MTTYLIIHNIGEIDDSLKKAFGKNEENFTTYKTILSIHLDKFKKIVDQLIGKDVVLTFDDAYEGQYEAILYALEKKVRCIAFIATDYVGSNGCKDVPIKQMTWDQIKTIHWKGCKIGSHTQSHPQLIDFTNKQERLITELGYSKEILQGTINDKVTMLAYPYSLVNDAVIQRAVGAGYTMGFTALNEEISDVQSSDVFMIPRFLLTEKTDLSKLGKLRKLKLKTYDDNDYWSKDNASHGMNEKFKVDHLIRGTHITLYNEIRKLKPERILEAGCGTGKNLKSMWILFPDKVLGGFDINPFIIDKAKNNLVASPVALFVSDAKKIKLGDNQVDVVFTNNLLQHISPKNIGKAISELIRVSSKYIIHSESCYFRNLTDAPELDRTYHPSPSFAHDYEKLYKGKGTFKWLIDNRDTQHKYLESVFLVELKGDKIEKN